MNSTVIDDLTRDHFGVEATKCIRNFCARSENIATLQKELLEINLSITAYIEESKRRLEALRLGLAQEARSSGQVVAILTEKCPFAIDFCMVYMIGMVAVFSLTLRFHTALTTVSLYLSLPAMWGQRKDDTILASPLHSPEMIKSKERSAKRRLRSNCNSPEWADGCDPDEMIARKRLKTIADSVEMDSMDYIKKDTQYSVDLSEINNKGDGILGRRGKRKCATVTPPNCEVGQGDCLPSTSGINSDKSHETLNSQLPKLAVECNGFIEFTRTRNNRSTDAVKWDRQCKVQICYSEDPLNIGEYIIWELRYTDESKCRRNLLSAFEKVANDLEKCKF